MRSAAKPPAAPRAGTLRQFKPLSRLRDGGTANRCEPGSSPTGFERMRPGGITGPRGVEGDGPAGSGCASKRRVRRRRISQMALGDHAWRPARDPGRAGLFHPRQRPLGEHRQRLCADFQDGRRRLDQRAGGRDLRQGEPERRARPGVVPPRSAGHAGQPRGRGGPAGQRRPDGQPAARSLWPRSRQYRGGAGKPGLRNPGS